MSSWVFLCVPVILFCFWHLNVVAQFSRYVAKHEGRPLRWKDLF
jgi:hypothetical protein